jgi:hypothetical protein
LKEDPTAGDWHLEIGVPVGAEQFPEWVFPSGIHRTRLVPARLKIQ